MPSKILFKRGTSTRLSTVTLSAGEPAFTTDNGKLYVGNGVSRVLINPIDMPSDIIRDVAYPKVKVNEYGQVTGQSKLETTDIPNLTMSKITDLGSCSAVNVGTTAGKIPTLDANGKFPISTMPVSNLYAGMAFYLGATITLPLNGVVKFSSLSTVNPKIILQADGGITLTEGGSYIVHYHVSAQVADLQVALKSTPIGNDILTGSSTHASSVSGNQYCTCSAMIAISTTSARSFYLVNRSVTLLPISNDMCTLSILKVQ